MFAKFDLPWGTIFGKGGTLLAANIGPERPILTAKIGPGDQFFAKIGPGGPILV